MLDPETAWQLYLKGGYGPRAPDLGNEHGDEGGGGPTDADRVCSPLYISTKTKIGYLDQAVPLAHVFWQIGVLPYHVPAEGVIKKQMKFNSSSAEELAALCQAVEDDKSAENVHVEEHVITHIENPGGRIPFKDVRKVSLGLCKKDVTSYRSKKKGAFYNCFVVILRLRWDDTFKEIHVKVFNTGKLEIPGIRDDALLERTLEALTAMLSPLMPSSTAQLNYLPERSETVLVNSNFSCNFFLDRQRLFDLLRTKYNISCSYDPCSYPGIQGEFYYDPTLVEQTGRQPEEGSARDTVRVSFMVFRTGSVLIVGKCSDEALNRIYEFICALLLRERSRIGIGGGGGPKPGAGSTPPRKPRKRTITVSCGGAAQAAS